ncbi:hypothetical protein FHL15_008732 [Xylaria flabelliformis]|uniref:Uncharacterized protein n=1 Tax=Xylaria flabelliformis TaxID=2512241 RepID=A0A553HQY4_9PEZI|nr:hypothetical protein FHL15_008732 [Xylaria flabelliformis]
MSSGTSGAATPQEASQSATAPSAGPSGTTTNPITQAPATAPSMEMSPLPKPNLGPNVTTHTVQTQNGIELIHVSHEVPTVSLRACVAAEITDAGDRAVNCCLKCICKACCGI